MKEVSSDAYLLRMVGVSALYLLYPREIFDRWVTSQEARSSSFGRRFKLEIVVEMLYELEQRGSTSIPLGSACSYKTEAACFLSIFLLI